MRRSGRHGTGGLWALVVVLLLAVMTPALAVEPSEMLPNPALEARAREIGRALRCVVCQNQAIDDSNAEVAHDMRRAVRERLAAGDTDAAVLTFVEARYGEFVLLRPRLRWHTLLLWLTPLLLLAGAAFAILRHARPVQRRQQHEQQREPPLHVPVLSKGKMRCVRSCSVIGPRKCSRTMPWPSIK